MSVYNGAEFLSETLDSLLAQTFSSFEVVIVDDASTDETPEILKTYQEKDGRFRILRNEINKERSFSRNRAIHAARGEYIAILDADDICLSHRLETQVAFMRQHAHVDICGSSLETFGETNDIWISPATHDAIIACCLFDSCLYHSTIIMRAKIFDGKREIYDPDMSAAEDYALWSQCILEGRVLANIPEVLVKYRVLARTAKYSAAIREGADRVRRTLLHAAGLDPTEAEFMAHHALADRTERLSISALRGCARWMTKLYAGVVSSRLCEPEAFRAELMMRWRQLAGLHKHNPIAIGVYLASEFGDWRVPFRSAAKKILR